MRLPVIEISPCALCPLQIHQERVTNKPPGNSVGRRWICSRVRAIKIFADASVDLAREEKLIFPVRFSPKFYCCRIGNLPRCCSLQFITGIKTNRSKALAPQWNNKTGCYSLGCRGEFIWKPFTLCTVSFYSVENLSLYYFTLKIASSDN